MRLTLLAALLLLAVCRYASAKRPVNPGIYSSPQACLDAMWTAANTVLATTDQIANCVRMCFHDAGTYMAVLDVGGADGSIQFAAEQAFPANAGLDICAAAIPAILSAVRAVPGCHAATFADVLQVSCAVGTFVLGGRPIPMVIGRPDATGPDLMANDRLPGPCTGVGTVAQGDGLIGFWQDRGMSDPLKATVVLNAAHGLGAVRANGPDCLPGGGAFARIRTAGPAFDGSYFNKLLDPHIQGHFFSDIVTVQPGTETLPLNQRYAGNHTAFEADWVSVFQEMSLLGCNATKIQPLLPSSFPRVRTTVGTTAPPPRPPSPDVSPPRSLPPPVLSLPPPPPRVLPPLPSDASPPPPPSPPPMALPSRPPPRRVLPPPPAFVSAPPTSPPPRPPPPPAQRKSPPPPARGPACGNRGRFTSYCPAFPKYKCCASKTCCPANQACCGTACCRAGHKCCVVRTFPTWRNVLTCKFKC